MYWFIMLWLTMAACWAIPEPAAAQTSVIEQIIQTRPAIVDIHAEITGVFQAPDAQPVVHPETGRLMMIRHVTQGTFIRKGAGVIIDRSGVIVTNAHNIERASRIKIIFHNGHQGVAQIVRYVANIDMALLKFSPSAPLTVVPLADSDQLQLGQDIVNIGNSPWTRRSISGGKIISLGTSRSSLEQKVQLIRTSLNVYHGDSGGPLFDRRGRLIGLITAKETQADRSSFAIPSNLIAKYLNDYRQSQQMP